METEDRKALTTMWKSTNRVVLQPSGKCLQELWRAGEEGEVEEAEEAEEGA